MYPALFAPDCYREEDANKRYHKKDYWTTPSNRKGEEKSASLIPNWSLMGSC
jgi:hypothetical protein